MEIFNELMKAFQEAAGAGLIFWTKVVALLWTIDQLLKIVVKITPFKWDDNLADILGNWLAKLGKK